MKLAALLAAGLALTAVLAGCTEKKDTPTTTPPSSTPKSSSPSPSPSSSSPQSSTPPGPKTVFQGSVKYGSPNEQKPFTVDDGAKTLDVTIYINSTAAGAYSVSGPGTPPGNPYVEIKDKAGTSTKIEFNSNQGTAVGGSTSLYGPLTKTIASPASGAGSITVAGTGTNVQADAKIVAKFT